MSTGPTRIERQAYDWLAKMLDDPGRHAAALERWLSKDPEHRAVYKRVAIEIGRASDSAARIPSLRAAPPSPIVYRGRAGPGRMVAIAALATVIAAAAGVLGARHEAWRNLTPLNSGADKARTYQAVADKMIKLADGSTVRLFAGGAMGTRFTERERAIDLLRGGARFTVSHNPERPFVVYAAGGKVTATGTVFEVAMAGGVRVRLVSGMVDVSLPRLANTQTGRVVQLHPGQQLTYQEVRPRLRKAMEPPAPGAGVATTESFDDVPASQIVDRVNQRSATKIMFADPGLGRRQVFGDLNLSDPDAVAQKLATLLGLIIDRSQPGRLILKSSK